jgi:hypothetical protein
VKYLCEQLGWELPPRSSETGTLTPVPRQQPTSVPDCDNAGSLLQAQRPIVNLRKRPSEGDSLGQRRRIRHPRRVGER